MVTRTIGNGMIATFVTIQPRPNPEAAVLRTVDLTGPAGRLEAVVNEGAADAPFAALVCHPHPLGGGSLHNKVVYHAMKALNAPEWGLHWPVLRFNFRGTGLSHGVHDGDAEVGDVLRHRSRASTMIYARLDEDGLRSVAQPWPVAGDVK